MEGKTLRRGSGGLYGSEVSGIRGIIVMCLQSTVPTRWRNFTMSEKSWSLLGRCEFEIFQFWGLHLFIGAGWGRGKFWNFCVAQIAWQAHMSVKDTKSWKVLKSKHVDVKLYHRPILMMTQKQQKCNPIPICITLQITFSTNHVLFVFLSMKMNAVCKTIAPIVGGGLLFFHPSSCLSVCLTVGQTLPVGSH